MKKTLLLILFIIPSFVFSQKLEKEIAKKWLSVYQFELDDLPKSALEVVDTIYTLAEKKGQEKQRIKALIYQSKFALTLEEDAQLSIIQHFKKEIDKSKAPEKNILESYLATLYLAYYNENRWRINRRTETAEKVDQNDFRTWDTETLLKEAKKHFQHSLQHKDELQKASIADYHLLMDLEPKSDLYRPTLYDVLAHNVLQFYADEATDMKNIVSTSQLQDTIYFENFLSATIIESDGFNPKLASLSLYQELISFHTQEDNIAAIVDLQIALLYYLDNVTQLPNANALYEQALEALNKKYASNKAVTLIQFELAFYEFNKGRKKQALAICQKAIEAYPESHGAEKCENLKEEILSIELNITAEEIISPLKHSKLLIAYTNIDSLAFSLYSVDYAIQNPYSLFRTDSAHRHFLKSHTPLKQFSKKLINLKDYRDHTTEVLIPPLPAGNYLVHVRVLSEEDPNTYAFTTIQVSNIGLISTDLDNSRRYQIINRINGSPLSGASIQLFEEGDKNPFKKIATDRKGFAFFDYPKNYLRNIDILVTHEKDQAIFTRNYIQQNYRHNRAHEKSSVDVRVKLLTDRSIYRPGQEVFFKGIVIQEQEGNVAVVAGEYVEVTLENVNGEEVGQLRLKTNEYGSITGSFMLPKNGLNGAYTLIAEEDFEEHSNFYDEVVDNFQYSSTSISVEEYKRPTFEVVFDPITASYSLNDSVTVKANAQAFSGAGIGNAKVSYTVTRKTQYQPWYYSSYARPYFGTEDQVINSGTTQTAANGEFMIPFKAIPDTDSNNANQPIFIFEVEAKVTDINGESRSNTTEIKLAYHRLQASIDIAEKINLAQKSFKVGINISNLNDQAVPAKGKLYIIKLEDPERLKIQRKWRRPDLPIISKEIYEKYFPHEGLDYNSIEQEWPNGDTLLTSIFDTNQKAKLSIEAKKDWPLGKYMASLTTKDSVGNLVEAKAYFQLFQPKAKQLAEKQWLFVETNKEEYKIGEKVKLQIGSSASDIHITFDIEKNHKIEESHIIHLSDEIKTIEIPVKTSDKEGFAIHYHYSILNTFESGSQTIVVQQEIPNFEIATTTFRDKLLPAVEESWSFSVLGENKAQQEVELLASMYDASLDQFKPHQWSFNPITLKKYYSYNRSSAKGFETKGFIIENLRSYYYRYPTPQYDHFNWFGFSFNKNFYVNNQYLSRLRSVFFTENSLSIQSHHDESKEKGFIYGRVVAEDGTPLPSVNVLVADTDRGVTTDIDGYYKIAAKKGEELIITYIGMESTKITIGKQNTIDVLLKSDVQQLSEVVVTAAGVERKEKALGYAVAEMANEEVVMDMDAGVYQMVGKVAGIEVEAGAPGAGNRIVLRGGSSISGENKPLYVVDGRIVTDLELSADDIASAEVLKGASATALYGSKASNGVIIITTKQGQDKLDKMLAQVKARTDLRETAFFFPQLQTNEQGEISFTFTSPEALTRWKLQLLAHNKRLKVGYKSLQTVTQKELMVSPNAPRFLRKGDQLTLSAKISNLSNEPLNGTIILVLSDAVSGKSVDADFSNTQNQQSFNIGAKNTTEVSWIIEVLENYDALQYKVVATTGDFSDGEQNVIPILPNKELVTESLPFTMRKAGTANFTFDRLKENNSSTLQHHQLTFELTTNPIWYAIKAMPYLMEYPYECSEQTFSRYFANKLGVQMLTSNPAIQTVFEKWKAEGNFESKLEQNAELKNILIQETPWLRDAQSEAEQQKRIALLFDLEKMDEQFQATLKKLEKMQLSDGGFPWFSGSGKANRYITQYIMMGLGQLQQLDSMEADEVLKSILDKGIQYLDDQIKADYEKLLERKEQDTKLDLAKQQLENIQVQLLFARSFYTDSYSKESQKAYDYYLKQSKTYWKAFDLKLRGMIALAQFRVADKKIAYTILASLNENSITNNKMGMYWKANQNGYYWMQSPIETQALMISLFDEIGSDAPAYSKEKLDTDLENLRVWLLRNKQVNKWPTTKATTQAIYALLLKNGEQLTQTDSVTIKLGNKSINSASQEMGAGYLKKSWNDEIIDESMANIQVSKQQDGIAFGAVYWQYFETLDQITGNSEGPLSLTKKVFKVNQNNTGELLSEVKDSTQLKLGDKLRIRIVLKSDRRMEFLHMKDQRAAGLEPVNVISTYKWQDGLGYYQSTKDASTNFFFDEVEKGVYVFEYDLLVNNAGSFQNGITTIESMYAPEFKSHSDGVKLRFE